MCVCVCALSCLTLCYPMDCRHQAPLSMEYRQEYWSGLPFPAPGDLLNSAVKPTSLASPALAGGFFNTGPPKTSTKSPDGRNQDIKSKKSLKKGIHFIWCCIACCFLKGIKVCFKLKAPPLYNYLRSFNYRVCDPVEPGGHLWKVILGRHCGISQLPLGYDSASFINRVY